MEFPWSRAAQNRAFALPLSNKKAEKERGNILPAEGLASPLGIPSFSGVEAIAIPFESRRKVLPAAAKFPGRRGFQKKIKKFENCS